MRIRISSKGPIVVTYVLSLMDWNVMEIQRVSLLNGFLTLFYLPIDLALLYRLSPLLYSVDAQILHAQIAQIVTLKDIRRKIKSKSLH